MNFQIPQFIEVEDKIFGPLSFKQFLYLVGGAGFAYLAYNLFSFLPLHMNAVPALALAGFGFALAFYKVNDRPMIKAVESAFWYYLRGRLYLWKKDGVGTKTPTTIPETANRQQDSNLPKFSESKLKDLSWSLDVNEKIK